MSLTRMFYSRPPSASTRATQACLWADPEHCQSTFVRGLAWVLMHGLMVIGLACALTSAGLP